MNESSIPAIIARLYALVDELESLFPERSFTLDGHLVGSIGEVAAKYFYKLKLLPIGSLNVDALTQDGTSRSVQIKLTAGDSVAVADYEKYPDLLVVLKIDRRSGFSEIYNGPYPVSLLKLKKTSKRHVKALTLRQLLGHQAKIQRSLDDEGRIAELNRLFQRSAA